MTDSRARQLLDHSGLISRVGVSLVVCGALAIPLMRLALDRGVTTAMTGLAVLFFIFMKILPVGRYVDRLSDQEDSRSPDQSPEEISRPKEAFVSYSRPRRSASLAVIGILLLVTAIYHAAVTTLRQPPELDARVTLYWLSVVLGMMGAGAIILWAGHRVGRRAADTYIEQLTARVEQSPDDVETVVRLGQALTLFERYEETVEVFDRVKDAGNRWAEVSLASGHAHYAVGNLDEALKRFDAVLEKDPDNIEALVERGSIYLDQGDLDRAKIDFARVEELEPKVSDQE